MASQSERAPASAHVQSKLLPSGASTEALHSSVCVQVMRMWGPEQDAGVVVFYSPPY